MVTIPKAAAGEIAAVEGGSKMADPVVEAPVTVVTLTVGQKRKNILKRLNENIEE